MKIENLSFPQHNCPAQTTRKRILLAEDNIHILHYMEYILKQEGFDVDSAADGLSAQKLYDESDIDYDLLITDNDMPGIQGLELTRMLKEQQPDLPVVFMCALDISAQVKEMFIDFDDVVFLHKPFKADQLLGEICQLLAEPFDDIRKSA